MSSKRRNFREPRHAETVHLKISDRHLSQLRKLAEKERRTQHNLAVLLLEQAIDQRSVSAEVQP